MSNTIPDDGVIPLDNYCPADRPFPPSYEAVGRRDPAECVAEDPCSPDGVTTLWHALPCTVETTAVVAVDEPPVPTLPATGVDLVMVGMTAVFAVVIGAGLRLVRR